MRKVVLYIAMSLDGYLADINGGVDWLVGQDSQSQDLGSYPDFIQTVDTVILGYNTYHQIATELSPQEWAYKGKTSYVLTNEPQTDTEDIIFTKENLNDLIGKLRKQEGKDIWICGGASIANQFIHLNLIDRYHITVIPTILGRGIRLFQEHQKQRKLQLLSTQSYNGMVDLVYQYRE